MADTFTYDLATDIGKVRLYSGDNDLSKTSGVRTKWSCQFTDEELQVYLDDEGTVNCAVAAALEAIASSKARLAHRKTMGDYTEDLTALAKELRAQAAEFRMKDLEAPADAVAEMANDDFSTREILRNQALRQS